LKEIPDLLYEKYMLVFTDEEVRRTHILGLLSEVQEPGYVLLEKGKFNIVTSVIKIKYCPSNLFLISNISSSTTILSIQ
jgi:hypothetical protein